MRDPTGLSRRISQRVRGSGAALDPVATDADVGRVSPAKLALRVRATTLDVSLGSSLDESLEIEPGIALDFASRSDISDQETFVLAYMAGITRRLASLGVYRPRLQNE